MNYLLYNLFYRGDGSFFILLLVSLALGGLTQLYIKSTYRKWSRVASANGLTGCQVAESILNRNGIGPAISVAPVGTAAARTPVRIARAGGGALSDHYDPRTNVVALSPDVYDQSTVSATAVAAHEVGHALQHARGYAFSTLRTNMVPVVNFAGRFAWVLIFIGAILGFLQLYYVGIAFFACTVLFQFVTLPVELNASSRALAQLRDGGLVTAPELAGARQVLTAAALTYVANALVSVLYLLYYLGIFRRR
ncbi:MAG: zinc metallopeptidase [Actinomycetes bacterium]|jgi:Zn-dependent membrane protease YugP|nr:zinc metallopeptidase [Actinomycetes bacterium]